MFSGLLPAETGQRLIAVVAVTIGATPLLDGFGRRLAKALESQETPEADRLASEASALAVHFIIAGFGRLGGIVGDLLAAQQIPYVAVDLDVRRVVKERGRGVPVYFGDAGRLEVLRAAGADRARGAIIALNAPEAAEQIVDTLQRNYPDLPTIVRSRDPAHSVRLARAGAQTIILESLEPALQMAARALHVAGATPDEAAQAVDAIRRRATTETTDGQAPSS
jgi:CPA2 family monovalent cation:H+ antiporter-2